MTKLSRKGPQPRVLILFNDVLLYGHQVTGGVKLRHQLPLQHMRVHASVDDGAGGDSQLGGFEFAIVSRKKSFLLRADTYEIRLQWMQALVDAVRDYEHRLMTFSPNALSTASSPSSSSSLNNSFDDPRKRNIVNPLFDPNTSSSPDTHHQQQKSSSNLLTSETLGEIAPVWVPDDRVSMCQLCLEEFTLFLRRHHCRACGKVICSSCSRFRAHLPYLVAASTSTTSGADAERVCEKCADILKRKGMSVVATESSVRLACSY